jgi:hypothetical protein
MALTRSLKPRIKRRRIETASAESPQLLTIRKYSIVVGIDPGTHTGMTAYDCEKKEYLFCETLSIHNAIFRLQEMANGLYFQKGMLIIVEDSRHISGSAEKKLGAGSIRRDCSIWEDFLTDLLKKCGKDINFLFIRPSKNIYLKMDPDKWRVFSKYSAPKLPSEHARDSATYLFKYINS